MFPRPPNIWGLPPPLAAAVAQQHHDQGIHRRALIRGRVEGYVAAVQDMEAAKRMAAFHKHSQPGRKEKGEKGSDSRIKREDEQKAIEGPKRSERASSSEEVKTERTTSGGMVVTQDAYEKYMLHKAKAEEYRSALEKGPTPSTVEQEDSEAGSRRAETEDSRAQSKDDKEKTKRKRGKGGSHRKAASTAPSSSLGYREYQDQTPLIQPQQPQMPPMNGPHGPDVFYPVQAAFQPTMPQQQGQFNQGFAAQPVFQPAFAPQQQQRQQNPFVKPFQPQSQPQDGRFQQAIAPNAMFLPRPPQQEDYDTRRHRRRGRQEPVDRYAFSPMPPSEPSTHRHFVQDGRREERGEPIWRYDRGYDYY